MNESRIVRPFVRVHPFSRTAHTCKRACKFPDFLAKNPFAETRKRGCTEIALPCFARVCDLVLPLSPVLFPLHYLTWVTYTIFWAAYLDEIHGENVIRSCVCAQRYFLPRRTRTLDSAAIHTESNVFLDNTGAIMNIFPACRECTALI